MNVQMLCGRCNRRWGTRCSIYKPIVGEWLGVVQEGLRWEETPVRSAGWKELMRWSWWQSTVSGGSNSCSGPCGRRERGKYEWLGKGQQRKSSQARRQSLAGKEAGNTGYKRTTGCLLGREKSFNLSGRELETTIVFCESTMSSDLCFQSSFWWRYGEQIGVGPVWLPETYREATAREKRKPRPAGNEEMENSGQIYEVN